MLISLCGGENIDHCITPRMGFLTCLIRYFTGGWHNKMGSKNKAIFVNQGSEHKYCPRLIKWTWLHNYQLIS